MPADPLPSEKLFDCCLIGLTTLRTERPDPLYRVGSSIVRALMLAGTIPERQRKQTGRDTRLIGITIKNAEMVYGHGDGTKRPNRRELLERAEASEKLMLLLIIPRVQIEYAKLFGAYGYNLIATNAGMEHARSLEPVYRNILTPPQFMTGWEKLVSQMRGMRAGKKGPSSRLDTTPVDTDDEPVTVPHPRHTPRDPKDYEW